MKLPVRQVIRAAYETIGQNSRPFLVISVVYAVITIIATKAASMAIAAVTGGKWDPILVDNIVWMVLPAIPIACVEVHWFRVLLLGETHNPRAYFRVRGRELRYAGVIILLSTLLTVPLFTANYFQQRLILNAPSIDELVGILYQLYAAQTLASIAISTLFAACLSPWLAVIAVDGDAQGIAAILRLTRGHRLRIGIIFLLAFEPLKLVLIAMELSVGEAIGGLNGWGIAYTAYVTWLSLCYLAITAEIYWELEDGQVLRNLGAVFD